MLKLKGAVTGIGSLPHKDAQAAVTFVLRYCPEVPFWPQLPKRDTKEGMIAQFSEGLPCLKATEKDVLFDGRSKDEELEKFYKRIIVSESHPQGDIEYFKISPDYAAGLYAFHEQLGKENLSGIKYIKCHITGPFTFAASLKDENGVALLHDPVLMQAIVEGLKMKVLWQVRFFWQFKKKIIVFIDEPYLGCFGSAFTPINREDAVRVLKELAGYIVKTGAVPGVHCCGNTDWSIFTDANIDILNFDAYGFLDKFVLYAEDLKKFNGDFCWGIVPTQEVDTKETAQSLVERLQQGQESLVKKGVARDFLIENLLLSPSCGLGTLTEEKAEDIFRLLKKVSTIMRNK